MEAAISALAWPMGGAAEGKQGGWLARWNSWPVWTFLMKVLMRDVLMQLNPFASEKLTTYPHRFPSTTDELFGRQGKQWSCVLRMDTMNGSVHRYDLPAPLRGKKES